MHDLFKQVLDHKDLSKAGELFSLDDCEVIRNLTDLLNRIQEIARASDYLNSQNDQSVVEICITRVTSAIRETGTIEDHAQALVSLLQSCLNHDLKPSSRDEDPPHAKVAADIISCIFLNYNKRDVMKLAIPVAVKFLHKGNRELCRNLSSYLSLAAINNAELLSKHIQPIIDSIISGNYGLARVLPQIYSVKKEPINDHVMALISLLPRCDNSEKLNLINLFGLIAKNKPSHLETNLPQLSECLSITVTSLAVLNVFVDMVAVRPQVFSEQVQKLKTTAEKQPGTLTLVCRVLGGIGTISKDKAKECLEYLFSHLDDVDHASLPIILKDIKTIMDIYPSFLPKHIAAISNCSNETVSSAAARMYIQQLKSDYHNYISQQSTVNQTSSGVTIVKVGGKTNCGRNSELVTPHHQTSYVKNRASPITTNSHSAFGSGGSGQMNSRSAIHRLISLSGINKSMPRLGSSSSNAMNKSMSKLSAVSAAPLPGNKSGSRFGSANVIHKSMSVISSSSSHSNSTVNRSMNALHFYKPSQSHVCNNHTDPVTCGGVAVMTNENFSHSGIISNKSVNGSMGTLLEEEKINDNNNSSNLITVSIKNESVTKRRDASNLNMIPQPRIMSSHHHHHHHHYHPSNSRNSSASTLLSGMSSQPRRESNEVRMSSQHGTNANITVISTNPSSSKSSNVSSSNSHHRISVFEPYPMRDAVQHFCEKHLQKIKGYMQKISVKLPLPVKCTIEERRSKKHAKLHFTCQGRGKHCLYSKTFFIMKTKNPQIWIHLMFLTLQARSDTALSQREQSVSSLKTCWDILKFENKTFLTLVTSAFPSAKDQEILIHELRYERFFDVFEYNGPEKQWGCFLCNHPERAEGFIQDRHPVIEGQLKEKKGRWKLFRRWRTRYFTLSGVHLSYKLSDNDNEKKVQPINLNQIRSVKAISSKRHRSIPKAFEIFTNEKTYVLKAKDSKNAEQWIQSLSIAVARSQSSSQHVHTIR